LARDRIVLGALPSFFEVLRLQYPKRYLLHAGFLACVNASIYLCRIISMLLGDAEQIVDKAIASDL
jgi:hypothetical protein